MAAANVRREFSARTKRQAWERAKGSCEGVLVNDEFTDQMYLLNGQISRNVFSGAVALRRCNAPLDHGEFHYDHIDPDWFSKDNELENCQVLCRYCHAAKTKDDVKAVAKSKRIIDKRIKARKKQGFKGWRKFDGTVVYAKR